MNWLRRLKRRMVPSAEDEELSRFLGFVRDCVGHADELSLAEKSEICASLSNAEFDRYEFESPDQTLARLRRVWNPQEPASLRRPQHRKAAPDATPESERDSVRYQEESALGPTITVYAPRQYWLIAMSRDFVKAIGKIDRKLQGRVLEAITEICESPLTARGDTVKPLSRELHGLWRYRVGDFRLLYQPLPDRQEILLVDFDSRDAVYE